MELKANLCVPAESAGLPFTRAEIESTLPARFEQVAGCFPNQIALTGKGQSWTYSDLNRRVNRIAHAIRAATPAGVGCVAFLVDQSPEMVIATLGVVKAGKIYLAIHPGMPATAQVEIVRDAGPQLLLSTRALAARAAEIAEGSCKTLVLDEADGRYSDENPEIGTGPGDPSTIFYTSGTTGKSKGVVKTHRAVLHRVWLSTQYDAIVPADRQSLLTHCSFSASEGDVFAALLQGARVCTFDLAEAGLEAFRRWIDEEQITLLHPPVLLFRRFLSTLDGENLFPSVRLVALAGDVVLPADLERWRRHFTRRCALLHRFSTTETALLTVAHVKALQELTPNSVPAGRPVADKFLHLTDEEGHPAGVGETGELVVRSAYLANGYWRSPDETAASFETPTDAPGERIYRTGDLCRLLPDGSVEFLGRRDHQAKIRGFRVDTREVDSALLELDGIAEAATVVFRDREESRLAAFVALKPGYAWDPATLRSRLRAQLPDWKVPAVLESVPALPITFTGKVDKQQLLAALKEESHPPDNRSGMEEASTLEEQLADVWRVALRLDQVGYDDHFLDLGGDSISALMTLNWVERLYGLRVTAANLFQLGTIRRLAELVRSSTTESQPKRLSFENVADGYVELLNAHGVEFIFVNPGTDTAPILESIAKCKAEGRRAPELVLCLHESIALAAAHGHFMVSGKPQVVMVHVDVGTQNLGANLHNAQRGRAGVVICAGRTPYTLHSGVPGGRNLYNHWIQEQFHQAGIVQGYVKWHYELTCPENLPLAVERAFQVAGTEPAGPVYLTLPREVLLEKCDATIAKGPSLVSAGAADPRRLAQAAQWLMEAEQPLILVSYAGRNPNAVAALVRLAECLAAPVVESRHRLNFPSRHPLHLGFSPARYLPEADCVLIVDHDVPWVPEPGMFEGQSRVIHIDIDPLKCDIPIWGFPVDLSIQADSALACEALAEEVERRLTHADRTRIEARREVLATEHLARRGRSRQRAEGLSSRKPIAPEWAAYCLDKVLDDDTVIVSETVTNTPVLWSYLKLDKPGTFFQSLGSGLGWGLGAALGAKLADPSKQVICVVGDGSWMFGSPMAVYWAAEQQRSPFLTVIFNNQQYFATIDAIATGSPAGYARRSGEYPACNLPKPPLYSKVAEAMGLWARTVDDPSSLLSNLREALAEVRGGRSALVDICVSSPMPEPLTNVLKSEP